MLGLEPFFFFETTEACENWEKLYRLERSVKEGASKFFSMFNEFEGVYHYLIEPLISDPEKLKIYNGRGAEWLFNYLTICRIVAPENYSKLKEILLDYEAKWTTGERTNPNFMFYHDRLDEILSYMESLDFSKMMNKSK